MSQNNLIYEELRRNANQWVSMVHLAKMAGSYAVNSRVSNLREKGSIIENKVEKVDGKNHSYYKLVLPLNGNQLSML